MAFFFAHIWHFSESDRSLGEIFISFTSCLQWKIYQILNYTAINEKTMSKRLYYAVSIADSLQVSFFSVCVHLQPRHYFIYKRQNFNPYTICTISACTHALISAETPQTFSLFSTSNEWKANWRAQHTHTHTDMHARQLRYGVARLACVSDRYGVVGYRFTVFTAQHISQLIHLKRSGFVFITLCFCLFILFVFFYIFAVVVFISFVGWCVIDSCTIEVNYWQTRVFEIR